ncbi:MAG TPA: hypothetical protein VEU06_02935 [Micropepsaceae bacterium]|nr:hypothetical protein [Micropepsaceae bacterium]
MTLALEALLSSPDLLPLRLDLDRERVWFAPLTADEYRRSAFLDDRMDRQTQGAYLIDLKSLAEHLRARPLPRPMHYILHGAHCCSTLLARCLQTLGGCFVLKEPYLLTQIAILKDCLSARPPRWKARVDDELPDWFKMSTLLLNRAYGAADTVVVKANDLCNGLGPDLLARDSRSKVIFVQSPLKSFLLSVLKLPGRREWARERLTILAVPLAASGIVDGLSRSSMSDAEAAAALWLYNCLICQNLLAGSQSAHVLALSGEAIAEDPLEATCLAARFLGLDGPEAPAARGQIEFESTRYAKDTALPYGAAARKLDWAEADAAFGLEAEQGIAWALRVAPGLAASGPFALR